MDEKIAKDMQLEEIMQAWSQLISHTGHLVSTKIGTLRMKQRRLKGLIPSLLAGYQMAIEHNLIEKENLPLSDLDGMLDLEEQAGPIMESLEAASVYCSLLTSKSRETSYISAKQCIQQVLQNYSYGEGQKDLIHFTTKDDFTLSCPSIFVETLLRDLVGLGLKRIKDLGQGSIKIGISSEAPYHIITMQLPNPNTHNFDISDEFERYMVEKAPTYELALGFCRLAILQMGGQVIYQSKEHVGTEIKICFLK